MNARSRALLVAAALTATTHSASADEPAAPAPPPQAQLEEAKKLFEQGESLRAAKQFQAALEAYLKSRALVPRATNTLNAGVCLYALGRYDEAYELFEEALSKYPETQLEPVARESAKKTMADIETKVGRLDVSANVDGRQVIDRPSRGKLPLLAPVRVLPGKHVVRVLRDGFATFEATVQIVAGETAKLDAKLEALTAAGRLRIEAPPELEGGEVVIDGAVVGTLPWEGTLQPGTHIYQVIKGGVGTAPKLAVVIAGQTVKKLAEPVPLGPERRIVVDPPTAQLAVDGVALGKGRFQGRLPLGKHVVEAREEGYFPARVPLDVTTDDGADFSVKLVVDPQHPRWASAAKARIGLGLVFGWQFASSFGNDATVWCRTAQACASSLASGTRFGVAGGYELPSRLGVFVEAGYASLTRSLERNVVRPTSAFPDLRYDLEDEFRLTSIWFAAGLGYRLPLGERFDLGARVMVAGARATARFTSSGTVSGGGRSLAATTENSGQSADGIMLDAIFDVVFGIWLGRHFRGTLGVAVPLSILRGPKLTPGDTRDAGVCDTNAPDSLECQPGQAFVPAGSAISAFFVRVVPQASVMFWF